MSSQDRQRLWLPRYWLGWLGLLLVTAMAYFPLAVQWRTGRLIGRVSRRLIPYRARIVSKNLQLCFPGMSPKERSDLERRTFESLGMSLVEAIYSWTRPLESISHRVAFDGLDELEAAAAEGRGVILAGGHYASLDLLGAVLAQRVPFDAVYRRSRNELMNFVILRARRRIFSGAIESRSLRDIYRRLRQGHVAWMAIDQDLGHGRSVFVPLFGIPTATVTAISRLSERTQAPVVLFSHFRDVAAGRWTVRLERLADLPLHDHEEAARYLNQRLERIIREHPEQYYWVHRRFKSLPDGTRRQY